MRKLLIIASLAFIVISIYANYFVQYNEGEKIHEMIKDTLNPEDHSIDWINVWPILT